MGSVNFFNTSLKLKNVEFKRISSEDAINIINSNFDIKDIYFIETGSDSLILISARASLKMLILYIGNDAIDFSGSKVILNNA